MKTTKESRSALRALEAKATRGEWRQSMTGYSVKSDDADVPIVAAVHGGSQATAKQFDAWMNNSDFIVAARNSLVALLDDLDEADRELELLRRVEEAARRTDLPAIGEAHYQLDAHRKARRLDGAGEGDGNA